MTDVMTTEVDTDLVTNPNTAHAQLNALDEQLIGQLVKQARVNGLQLTAEGRPGCRCGWLQPLDATQLDWPATHVQPTD